MLYQYSALFLIHHYRCVPLTQCILLLRLVLKGGNMNYGALFVVVVTIVAFIYCGYHIRKAVKELDKK